MEHDPQPFYERKSDDEVAPLSAERSREQLTPRVEPSASNPEVKSTSPNFEELVHQALEEELKYERDPNLRSQASQRADQILAEFAEAKNAQGRAGNLPERNEQNNKLTPELARQLGIKDTSRQPKPAPRGTSANLGILDLVMAIIITVLLIIVILLLIF